MQPEREGGPVECRSDGDYAGRPLAILWQGQRCIVDQVVASWRTPESKCYRVMTLDGVVFDCCYSAAVDAWTIDEVEHAGQIKKLKEPK